MELTVDRYDLKIESQRKACSLIGFDDLRDYAQKATRICRYSVFKEFDGSNYTRIYVPFELSQ